MFSFLFNNKIMMKIDSTFFLLEVNKNTFSVGAHCRGVKFTPHSLICMKPQRSQSQGHGQYEGEGHPQPGVL